MSREPEIRTAFPELASIEDDGLRARTLDAWDRTLEEVDAPPLESIPWLPPEQERFGLPDETLVDHIRDVAQGGVALADLLTERRGDAIDIDLDVVLAGALVHDISKLYEFDGMDRTPIGALVGHPYYGLYAVGRSDLGAEIANIVVSHTRKTDIEPATLEAELVRLADWASAAAIRSRAVDDLRDV